MFVCSDVKSTIMGLVGRLVCGGGEGVWVGVDK